MFEKYLDDSSGDHWAPAVGSKPDLGTPVSVTRLKDNVRGHSQNVRAPASEASILLRICHELHVAMSSHNLISNTISLSSYHHFEKAVFEISDPRPSGIRYFK